MLSLASVCQGMGDLRIASDDTGPIVSHSTVCVLERGDVDFTTPAHTIPIFGFEFRCCLR